MDESLDALAFASVSIEADEGCGHKFVYTKILHHQVTRATFHRYAEDTLL